MCPDRRMMFFWAIIFTYKPKDIIMSLKSIHEYDPTLLDKIEEKFNLQFRTVLNLERRNDIISDRNVTSGKIYRNSNVK